MLALLEAFREHGGFEIELIASGVARRMLQAAGERPRAFTVGHGRDFVSTGEPADELVRAASDLLDETGPDVVLGSLSSCGVGIDEALVAAARCPTFIMQDFWGDANLGIDVPPALFLAMDEYAVQLTSRRWNLSAVAVGSPKHSRYRWLDVMAMRHQARAAIGIDDPEQVIGFFGQSPTIPGHDSAFIDFASGVARLRPRPLLLVREHLKFRGQGGDLIGVATDLGLRVVNASDGLDVEPWLAACDVVVTPFSLCGLDHAYLSAHSRRPVGVVVYMLPNPEIQQFMERVTGLNEFPTVERGMGTVVRRPEEIVPALDAARQGVEAQRYFEASEVLRHEGACRRVIDVIEARSSLTRVLPAGVEG